MNLPVTVRPMEPQDKHFIYSTYLRGLYYGSDFYGKIAKDVFFASESLLLDDALLSAEVLVAHLPEDSDIIIGYAIVQGPSLRYCFVKDGFRHKRVMSTLLQNCQIKSVNRLTKVIESVMIKRQWTFNPYV